MTSFCKYKNNKIIAEIPSYEEIVIKSGEKKNIGTAIDKDLSNAKSVEYSN